MRRWVQATVGGGVAIALLASAQSAVAAPGDVDAGFGASGTITPIAGQAEAVTEAGGKILTVSSSTTGAFAGVVHVRRYLATGAPDPTFSADGAVDIVVAASVLSGDVAVDGSGRVVVAAGIQAQGSNEGYRVWRFEADGDPDPAFSSDGVASVDAVAGFSQVIGLGVQADGEVILGANDTFISGGLMQLPRIVRFTAGGAVAQSVDVLADYGERGAMASLAVDGSGRTLVLVPDDGKLSVRRYTADTMVLDLSFGGDGIVDIARPGGAGDNDNWGGALDVTTAGIVTVAGTVGSHTQIGAMPPVDVEQATLVARITANGAPDVGFSADGIASAARPTGSISPVAVGPTASGGVAVAAWREVEGQDTASVAWEFGIAGVAEPMFSGDGRVERAGWTAEGTVAAGGTRLLLFEIGTSFTSSSLTSVQLVTPPAATVPGAPAAPTVPGAARSSLDVAWKNPAVSGGKPVTSYDVLVYAGSSGTPVSTIPMAAFAPTGSFQLTATGLAAGTRYRFKVRATNSVGTGAASAFSTYGIPPFRSADRLVNQQFGDFIGRTPSTTELADLRSRITAGTTTPAAAIAEVSNRSEWTTLDAVTRIYYAFFGRPPDTGGLTYWLGKRRAGVKVSAIANQFVASNEFKTKYGSLSNRAFVELVYQNVLGRPGDSVGVNSWTTKLDSGALTRGALMAQFSESGEHQRRRAGEVNAVSIFYGMLLRSPTSAELTTWKAQVTTTEVPLITSILGTLAYDNRVPGN